jgi:hypothetical protein
VEASAAGANPAPATTAITPVVAGVRPAPEMLRASVWRLRAHTGHSAPGLLQSSATTSSAPSPPRRISDITPYLGAGHPTADGQGGRSQPRPQQPAAQPAPCWRSPALRLPAPARHSLPDRGRTVCSPHCPGIVGSAFHSGYRRWA